MNRNSESHFATLPEVNIERSVMDLSHGYITTLNCGDLIPFFYKEVLAGDTWEINTSIVCRAQTMLTPIFSNINIDYYYFFVPFRLMWEHFPEFFGENRSSAWVQPVTYTVPTISAPEGGFIKNTLADYFGWPLGLQWSATDKMAPTVWKPRCYSIIADQWFRDQNVTDPLNIPLGDSNQTGTNGTNYINDCANAGMPFKAAKYHDYFTSCLPDCQKSTRPVSFNLLNNNKAPVVTGSEHLTAFPSVDMKIINSSGSVVTGLHNMILGTEGSGDNAYNTVYARSDDSIGEGTYNKVVPSNLWADLSSSLGAITINELRLAFQLQKFYEKQARAGSRLTETLHEMFGVTNPDARLQRSEYLGGKRVPLIVHEVTNTSQTATDFLGDVGAKLATSDVDGSVFHSFTEPGYLMGVAVIRYPHYYTQGFDRSDLRKKFEDFYWPVFANIGEQPVYDAEIYADATTMSTGSVFGFQEAWADYRYAKDICTSEMRPGITGSLASWHLADYYTAKPTLSDSWIREDKTNVDRTLAVTSSVSNQFLLDMYFDCKVTRPMPVYSIPGLIDHH